VEALPIRDVRRLLEVAHELSSTDRAEFLSVDTLGRLRELIPCRDATYFDWSRRVVVGSRDISFPRPVVEAMETVGGDRPSAAERLRSSDGAVRLSALMTWRGLLRLGFYQQVMRPLGMQDELTLRLPGREPCGLSLISDRRFDERDQLILDALAPYLARARERVVERQRQSDPRLTDRERDVLAWVARGKTNKEIASLLGVKPGTVRKHLENVYDKLGVHTRTGAVARSLGLDRR